MIVEAVMDWFLPFFRSSCVLPTKQLPGESLPKTPKNYNKLNEHSPQLIAKEV